jgi:hypothetical protein
MSVCFFFCYAIYAWPVSLLKELEKWIRNFLWSGDIYTRKMVTVAWKKVCSDYVEGGLGIKSLICLNEATNLKLCWEMLQSHEQWAKLLRSRVLRGNHCITHHILSSIWSGIKNEYFTIVENSNWLIGNGLQVNFWTDSWCGVVLADHYQVSDDVLSWLPSKV